MTTNMKHDGRPSREWLRRMADAEDRCESVAVGGLAADVGMFEGGAPSESPRVFGRLIEFARRSHGLSVEDLAKRADVELAELLSVEGRRGGQRAVRSMRSFLRAYRHEGTPRVL